MEAAYGDGGAPGTENPGAERTRAKPQVRAGRGFPSAASPGPCVDTGAAVCSFGPDGLRQAADSVRLAPNDRAARPRPAPPEKRPFPGFL